MAACERNAKESLQSALRYWSRTPQKAQEGNLCNQSKKKFKKRNVISKKSDFMAKSLDIKSISQTVLRLPVMWIFTGMPNGTSPTVLPLRSELGFPSVNFSTRYCKTKRLVGVRNLDQKENALSYKIYILNRYYDE